MYALVDQWSMWEMNHLLSLHQLYLESVSMGTFLRIE